MRPHSLGFYADLAPLYSAALCYLCALPKLLTYLEPHLGEVAPATLPSPFATEPHPIARRAAQRLQQELRAGAHDALAHDFDAPGEGKMLGVLVVRDRHNALGFLRAGSGMLGGTWRPVGFVPPLFDDEDRARFWPAGQRALDILAREVSALVSGDEVDALASRFAALRLAHEQAALALRREHKANKAARARARRAEDLSPQQEQRLGHESQRDRLAGKALRAEHKAEIAVLQAQQEDLDRRIKALKERRADTSNALLAQIQDGYRIRNALGTQCSLDALYSAVPPGGSGDCAGPKLLGYAYEHALTPVAFAEFWWGATPVGGGRHAGQFYPACRGKCGPLLAFMMQGLAHEAPPLFGSETPVKHPPATLFEDEHLLVVDKPEALLSVPGATRSLRDSALTRLRAAHEGPGKPLQVHRLDRDTSGVLLLAKTRDAHRKMQALFAERSIEKRYVAWLDGTVDQDRGQISLALRVDLDDRPRQIVDPVHGKEALTDFVVLARKGGLTKVALFPRTGRTHQLRVHLAHPLGLGIPIVGDRLYGKPGPRLALHAESLRFTHPASGEDIEISCPPPSGFDPVENHSDSGNYKRK